MNRNEIKVYPEQLAPKLSPQRLKKILSTYLMEGKRGETLLFESYKENDDGSMDLTLSEGIERNDALKKLLELNDTISV